MVSEVIDFIYLPTMHTKDLENFKKKKRKKDSMWSSFVFPLLLHLRVPEPKPDTTIGYNFLPTPKLEEQMTVTLQPFHL